MPKVAINGMGRIGRAVLRVVLETPQLELAAVNDLMPVSNLAYLIKYDSVSPSFRCRRYLASSLKLFRQDEQQKTEYAKIDCAVCRFDISDGIAQSHVLVFDTARAGVVGDGQIDLKNEKLDIALKPVTGGIGITGLAKLKVGTSSIADSFKLGGRMPLYRLFMLGKNDDE